MAYNASTISTVKKLTLVPIVGYLEETKPFARASKDVDKPGAGPDDEKSNSSLSETAIELFGTITPQHNMVFKRLDLDN